MKNIIIGTGLSANIVAYYLDSINEEYTYIELGSNDVKFIGESKTHPMIEEPAKTCCAIGLGGNGPVWGKGFHMPSKTDLEHLRHRGINITINDIKKNLTFFNDGVENGLIKISTEKEILTIDKHIKQSHITYPQKHITALQNAQENTRKKNVILNARINKILLENDVHTVHYSDNNGEHTIDANKIFCCAGAIGTPTILSTLPQYIHKKIACKVWDHFMCDMADSGKFNKLELPIAYKSEKHKDDIKPEGIISLVKHLFHQNNIFGSTEIAYTYTDTLPFSEIVLLQTKSKLDLLRYGINKAFKNPVHLLQIYQIYKRGTIRSKYRVLRNVGQKNGKTRFEFNCMDGNYTSDIKWKSGVKQHEMQEYSKSLCEYLNHKISVKKIKQRKEFDFVSACHPYNVSLDGTPVYALCDANGEMKENKNFFIMDTSDIPMLEITNPSAILTTINFKKLSNIFTKA